MKNPDDIKYTKSHEWVRVEGNTATVGITKFAVDQLGDVTLVELPAMGETVTAGDGMGTIESVKAVSDLYAPINGTVCARNDALEEKPELVNDDCFGAGWMVKVELAEESGVDALMDAATYDEYLDSLD